jgi:ribosomal subunit interface protein
MIQLQITGRHFELDSKIVDYTEEKIGKLDRYLPHRKRDGLQGTIVLEFDESHTQDSRCICEANLDIPAEALHAKEATMNMYAAIDICEQKLKQQILRYKSKHDPARNRRERLWARLRREQPTDPEIQE